MDLLAPLKQPLYSLLVIANRIGGALIFYNFSSHGLSLLFQRPFGYKATPIDSFYLLLAWFFLCVIIGVGLSFRGCNYKQPIQVLKRILFTTIPVIILVLIVFILNQILAAVFLGSFLAFGLQINYDLASMSFTFLILLGTELLLRFIR